MKSVPYLISGIPCIFGIPNHVFTAVGVLISPRPINKLYKSKNIRFFEDWISGFVVHDDAVGPYRIVPIEGWLNRSKLLSISSKLRVPTDKLKNADTSKIDAILVPCIEDMWLHIEDARYQAIEMCLQNGKFWDILASKTRGAYPRSIGELCEIGSSNLVIRWRVVSSKKYKKNVLTKNSTLYKHLINVHMPRTIWLAELLWEKHMIGRPEQWKVCGEIVVDMKTGSFSPSILAVHLPGLLYLTDLEEGWYGLQNGIGSRVEILDKDEPRLGKLDIGL
jgi:hypothetical protein